MYCTDISRSLIQNWYFFLGLHTALHVKVCFRQKTGSWAPSPMQPSLYFGNMGLRQKQCLGIKQALLAFGGSCCNAKQLGLLCTHSGMTGNWGAALCCSWSTMQYSRDSPQYIFNTRLVHQALQAALYGHPCKHKLTILRMHASKNICTSNASNCGMVAWTLMMYSCIAGL